MVRTIALIAACGFALGAAAAEPEAAASGAAADAAAPAATPKSDARGYVAFGLTTSNATQSAPGFPDFDSSGGGLFASGAGHSGKVNPSLDIAFRGEAAIVGREFDGGGEVADVLVEIDGGIRLGGLLMLTLGYTTMTTAYDSTDIATTLSVIPLGVGVLHTTDAGYVLAQLRVGGGRIGSDQNNDTESVDYFGLRAAVQHGFSEGGVQFMLGLGLDRFEYAGIEDQFVRLDFGLGFGF